MNKRLFFLLTVFVMLAFAGCKDPYDLPPSSVADSYLVVEGYLSANSPTTITLSRTFKLDDTARARPELRASVSVEAKSGVVYPLAAIGNGKYQIERLPMQSGEQYRLHIRTAANQEYFSEFIDYKQTPAIDSITWKRLDKGVQVYANTHDPQNDTRYYRWDYDETWEFHSAFLSNYDYVNKQIVLRDQTENISVCWTSAISTHILLGSSAKLQNDVIAEAPLTLIPNRSWKLSVKYSILVRQYGLTEKAYQYWQNVMKNSEKLGSIFDPQPTEIKGNLYSATNANEVVIGFISAGTVEEKRLFIAGYQVPFWGYGYDCTEEIVVDNKDSLENLFGQGNFEPINEAVTATGALGYSYSRTDCVDCRLLGINVRPPFWQ